VNAIDKKFDEWFDKTSFAGKGALGIARMAYEQALIDFWDLPITDICDVATKHGKVVQSDGTVADILKNGHTAAEFFADPDGYDEYDLKTTVVRPDPRPHCCYHPKYHGERCVQIRKGETHVCEECENIYKQVQEAKKRGK
jgi:hypothetical protein